MENENNNKINPLNALYNAWKDAFKDPKYVEKNEYLATADKNALKEGVKLYHFYHTHVVPLPFWGNIYDPDYIVLSHNPSCEPIVDELESLFFYQKLKNTLESQLTDNCTKEDLENWLKGSINWLNREQFDLKSIITRIKNEINDDTQIKSWVETNYNMSLNDEELDSIITLKNDLKMNEANQALEEKETKKNKKQELKAKEKEVYNFATFTTTSEWWNEVFDNFNESDREKIFEKVGFFNLCGYHSRSYVEVPRKYLSKDYLDEIKKENESIDNKNIPTIRATIKYIQHLIKKGKVKIILVWGTEWKDYIGSAKEIVALEKANRLIIVNKKVEGNSTRNKVINTSIINYYKNKYNEKWFGYFFNVFPARWSSKEKPNQ